MHPPFLAAMSIFVNSYCVKHHYHQKNLTILSIGHSSGLHYLIHNQLQDSPCMLIKNSFWIRKTWYTCVVEYWCFMDLFGLLFQEVVNIPCLGSWMVEKNVINKVGRDKRREAKQTLPSEIVLNPVGALHSKHSCLLMENGVMHSYPKDLIWLS